MSTLQRFSALGTALALTLQLVPVAQAAAYDGHPKIVVIVVIDQFRADYLERYRADFKARGFRLFFDHGAYFPDCYYGYANTKTAPGHATIGTGAYTDGHGIGSNEWWDLSRNKQRPVSSVEDERYGIVGLPATIAASAAPGVAAPASASAAASPVDSGAAATQPPATQPPATQPPAQAQASEQPQAASPSEKQPAASTQAGSPPQTATPLLNTARPGAGKPVPGSSPRNLLASTVGDELRLATAGASQVWGISLKDRAAILPAGAAANGAFWIDSTTGRFVTSTYYMQYLPDWATAFNEGSFAADAEASADVQQPTSFYNQVGRSPAANTYELAFAEALITGEQLGKHPTTDLITVSLSANDILGHQVGPDSPEQHAMVDALDTDLDSFFSWLDKNVDGGLGNVWVALTADHGIAPTPAASAALGLKGAYLDLKQLTANLNDAINQKFSPGENNIYLLPQQELPYLQLNEPVFARAGINEQEAEQAVQNAAAGAVAALSKPDDTTKVAEARLTPVPQLYRTYTRQQLATGELPSTQFGQLLQHSYTPNGGWYVMVMPVAFQMDAYGNNTGTTHYSPFSYDRHVPLGFYGAPFAPGLYRGRVQPVDLAATLASLLGINQPSASVGQILTQALKPSLTVVYPKDPPPPGTRPRPRSSRHHRSGDASDLPGSASPDTVTPSTVAPDTAIPAPPAPLAVKPTPDKARSPEAPGKPATPKAPPQ